MDSTKNNGEMAVNVPESKLTNGNKAAAAAAVAPAAPATVVATTKAAQYSQGGWKRGVAAQYSRGGWKRGVAIFDFILRLCAVGAALAATSIMGTTDQTLPFFTQFFQFQASYDDFPTFTFFVIANAIASAYLVLSLPFSIVSIVRPHIIGVRLLLIIFDTVMAALTTAAASAAGAIVYLANNGNPNTNWIAICQQFDDFCQSVNTAVVASFVAAVIFMFLIVLSAFALRKH